MNRKKIVIIDDDAVILKALKLKLQADYEVFTALDGSDGVAIVRKEDPDLVLLDISFPPEVAGVPWDGFRIIQWLRIMDPTKRQPGIIVMTMSQATQYKERALAEGALAFFQKPINNDELLATIHQALNDAPTTK